MNGLAPGQAQAMERARAMLSAIREWLFSQGANAQGEGPEDVTCPVSHEAMLQVTETSLAMPIGAARSLRRNPLRRPRTPCRPACRSPIIQNAGLVASLPLV